MSEPRTPESIRAALEDLVKSEGWALLREMVDEQFGAEANLQAIDDVMANLKPGDDERAVVTQIRAAAKAAYTVLALPDNKLRAVKGAQKPGVVDRFKHLRRQPHHV